MKPDRMRPCGVPSSFNSDSPFRSDKGSYRIVGQDTKYICLVDYNVLNGWMDARNEVNKSSTFKYNSQYRFRKTTQATTVTYLPRLALAMKDSKTQIGPMNIHYYSNPDK